MNSKRRLFYGAGVLQLFVSIGAIAAGIGLILKPDGSNLGMSVEILRESPFNDFLVPGIALLSINGLGSMVGSFFSLRRHFLAGQPAILLGCFLVIWISAQVYWIGLISWLQPVFFVVGLIEVYFGVAIMKKIGAYSG